jgi:nicotinate-nucleotide adenylyltransferase
VLAVRRSTPNSSPAGKAADLAAAPAGRIVPFAITALEISATAIRRRLAADLSARYLVPDPVLDYIESHQLYRTPHGH